MEQVPTWVRDVLRGFGPEGSWGWRWDEVGPFGTGELVLLWSKASSDVGVTYRDGFLRLDNGIAEQLFLPANAHECGKAAKDALYRWQE